MVKQISKSNVGRIAERIVANELEARGFRVSDLNKEGLSANADLLAAKGGKVLQVQVKGATYDEAGDNNWWFNYGHCKQEHIDSATSMFNSASSFYIAQVVVLVSVKEPSRYECIVLPLEAARRAVELNLDHTFRTKKRDGTPKKPGKVWSSLDYLPKSRDASKVEIMRKEQKILQDHLNNWGAMDKELAML